MPVGAAKVVIICENGLSNGVRLVDLDTGGDLLKQVPVESVDVHIAYGQPVYARIALPFCGTDVVATPSWYMRHPDGDLRELRKVVFADGSSVEFAPGEIPSVVREGQEG